MTDMTLAQVRDVLRNGGASERGQYEYFDKDDLIAMADAIDAHLAKAAQPVEALEFLAVAYEESGNSLIAKALRANGPSKNAYDYEIAIKAISAALAHPRPTE